MGEAADLKYPQWYRTNPRGLDRKEMTGNNLQCVDERRLTQDGSSKGNQDEQER
jgi:hypothetical protein